MAKYKVKNTSILHNQKVYAEGSEIELTEVQAKRLEDFVELIPETTKPQTQTQNKTQTSKTTKTKSETKTETKTEKPATGETEANKDGGVDNDK